MTKMMIKLMVLLATLILVSCAAEVPEDSSLDAFGVTGELKLIELEQLLVDFPAVAERLKNPMSAEADGLLVKGIALGGGSGPAHMLNKTLAPGLTGTWGTTYLNCETTPCKEEWVHETQWGFSAPATIDASIQNGAIYYTLSQMMGITGVPDGKRNNYTHEYSMGVAEAAQSQLAKRKQSADRVVVVRVKSSAKSTREISQKAYYIRNDGSLIGVSTTDSNTWNGTLVKEGPSAEIHFFR